MKDNRFKLGVMLSILWIVIMVIFICLKLCESLSMKPNEWGDFFSGFFSPLAFLWLVLGYLQQGEELQNSVNALRLQAEELKNSVEKQSEMVEISKKQFEKSIEQEKTEKEAAIKRAQPIFDFLQSHGGSSGYKSNQSFSIKNSGGRVRNWAFEFPQGFKLHPCSSQLWEGGETKRLNLEYDGNRYPYEFNFNVSYTDERGEEGIQKYKFKSEEIGKIIICLSSEG